MKILFCHKWFICVHAETILSKKSDQIKLGKARVWGLLFTDGAALLPQLLRQVSANRVIKTKPFLLFHSCSLYPLQELTNF